MRNTNEQLLTKFVRLLHNVKTDKLKLAFKCKVYNIYALSMFLLFTSIKLFKKIF